MHLPPSIVPINVIPIPLIAVLRADAVKCAKCGASKVESKACPGCGDES